VSDSLLGLIVSEPRCDLVADVRRESIPRQQRVRLLTSAPGIRLAAKRRGASIQEFACGIAFHVSRHGVIGPVSVHDLFSPGGEHLGDGVGGHALELELAVQRYRPSRLGSVPALDPGPSEVAVVQVTHLDEPRDDLITEPGWVAEVDEASPSLLYGT